MKKMMKCVMALVMVASMTGCGKETKVPTEPVGENTQIPNPFAECETIEEAEKLAGFDLVIPEKVPEGFSDKNISAIQDEMIDITYDNGEDKLCIRKGKGAEDIWEAVKSLPVKYREVTHLYYHEGYSTSQIASLLGKNEQTVRSLLHRARGKLKLILKEVYDFEG